MVDDEKPTPQIASVCLANASIELFSILFPLQSDLIQAESLNIISKHAKPISKVSSSRKYALQVNSVVAIVGSLKYMMIKKGSLKGATLPNMIFDLVKVCIAC
jgi:hypothetical protein